ncbi:MAG: hypothetical protein WD794_09905 [Mycobacteriales bacterium]
MAPVEQLLPGHFEPYDEQSEEHRILMAALAELPDETHQRILADIMMTARRCRETQDYQPLDHLTTSVYATALLRRNPEYLAALELADNAEAEGPPQTKSTWPV